MGLFDFLHKPKQDTRSSIEQIAKGRDRKQKEDILLYGASIYGTFRHSDNSLTDLVKASVIIPTESGTYLFYNQTYICFEIPHDRTDLIQAVVSKIAGLQLSNDSYTYIGRAYDDYDIRLQPPTATINSYVDRINLELQEELQQERKEWEQQEQQRLQEEAIKREEKNKILDKELKEHKLKLLQNINNPKLKKAQIPSYRNVQNFDGTDMRTGEVLRLRGVQLKDRDENNFVYVAELNSTPSEHDVEFVNTTEFGVPVVFTLPYNFQDLLGDFIDPQQKQIIVKAVLTLLSQGYYNHLLPDGKWDTRILHDIGGVDREGKIFPHIRGKATDTLMNKITNLQRQYYSQKQSREEQDFDY